MLQVLQLHAVTTQLEIIPLEFFSCIRYRNMATSLSIEVFKYT